MAKTRSQWPTAGGPALVVGLALLASACRAGSPSRCPATPDVVVVAPLVPPAVLPAIPSTAATTEPRESPCWKNGRPKSKAIAETSTTWCNPFDRAELARVEGQIRSQYVLYNKPAKLVVDFGCDVAGETIAEATLEDGSGHGGSLRLVRFQRTNDVTVRLRRVAWSHYFDVGLTIESGEIGTPDFDRLVSRSRVALLVRPHAIPLKVTNGAIGFSMMSSSHDYHLRLRLEDAEALATDRSFTGYESSGAQEESLPLKLATDPWEAALQTVTWSKALAPTDDDRAFFTARFTETFAKKPYWWIGERFVAMAAELGTVDLLPLLAKIANERGSASVDRTRAAALGAIAKISGWDPRVGPRGEPRSIDEAAATAASACLLTTPG